MQRNMVQEVFAEIVVFAGMRDTRAAIYDFALVRAESHYGRNTTDAYRSAERCAFCWAVPAGPEHEGLPTVSQAEEQDAKFDAERDTFSGRITERQLPPWLRRKVAETERACVGSAT